MKADVGFLASLTEFEAGWGQRPDGYILADTLNEAEALKKEIEERGSYQCYVRAGDIKQVLLTNEGVALLNSEKSNWVSRKDIDKYIKMPS